VTSQSANKDQYGSIEHDDRLSERLGVAGGGVFFSFHVPLRVSAFITRGLMRGKYAYAHRADYHGPEEVAHWAVYQLGPFGTAAKKLQEWDLKP